MSLAAWEGFTRGGGVETEGTHGTGRQRHKYAFKGQAEPA